MREYPNVWPHYGLFAFSGIDGETKHAEPFVAASLPGELGWRFWLKPRVQLRLLAGDTPLAFTRTREGYCLPDCWEAVFRTDDVEVDVAGAFVDRRSFAMRLAPREGATLPALTFEPVEGQTPLERGAAVAGEGWWLAWAVQEGRASVAISYQRLDDAVDGCTRAMDAELDNALTVRRAFCDAAAVPESLHDNRARTYRKAVAVQKVNVESAQGDIPVPWTTPDRMPHRHMWLWDSAFHAVGLAHLDPPLAESALAAVFAKQLDDGRVGLMAYPGSAPDLVSESQPPILAWAVEKVQGITGRCAFPEQIYANLRRYLEWFERNRRLQDRLFGWAIRHAANPTAGARGGESGMDNSPRFDEPGGDMAAIDLCSYMASEYRCMTRIALTLGIERDAELWAERHADICNRVNDVLWDDETRFYYDHEDALVRVKAAAGFLPLLGGIPDRDRAEALRQHLVDGHTFATPVPIPTIARDEPTWSNDMWRGPAWMNLNLLVYDGLCQYGFLEESLRLARRTTDEIARWYAETGCLYEYYDATGETPPSELPRKGAPGDKNVMGFGVIADYHWTAAVYIHLANRLSS